ncbi:excisionase family DNA binding protein [Bacillus ectoiniformans]|uniref:helix-turn-helix domain-containing protein n=1 Tax=Bacillus ectoiniformans TaxID=1494429 RepID=UPI0019572D61|nr:excisionase family DNA binding protein [Bacillus ectoiniformans]
MYQLTKYDEENLWNTISTLTHQEFFGEARTLIKVVMESTIAPTPFTGLSKQIASLIPSPAPFEPESIEKMKEIDRRFRETLNRSEFSQAKLALLDYVDLTSKMFADAPDHLKKELIASLISFSEQPAVSFSVKEMYSTKEAAELLGLSDQTIRRMCEKGKFPGAVRTDGGHWRIPKENFKVTKEQSQQIKYDLKDIRQKALDGGEVDEFDLT